MNISTLIKSTKSIITANSPVLLVGASIAGIVSTGVLAARAGYKARGIVDEAQKDKVEPLSGLEKTQLTWLCYAAPALTGFSAMASTIGVHTIHTKRHAAMAGLYAMTTTKLDDYSEKAEELLGAKKAQTLKDDVAQKAVDRNPPLDSEIMIIGDGTGQELCYDETSGRYFMGSAAIIERAVNEVNRNLIEDNDVSLNDFYDYLGLTPIGIGTNHGWNEGERVEIRFGSVTTTDMRPALSFWFHTSPKEYRSRN